MRRQTDLGLTDTESKKWDTNCHLSDVSVHTIGQTVDNLPRL